VYFVVLICGSVGVRYRNLLGCVVERCMFPVICVVDGIIWQSVISASTVRFHAAATL
jgi:hypothetical protein